MSAFRRSVRPLVAVAVIGLGFGFSVPSAHAASAAPAATSSARASATADAAAELYGLVNNDRAAAGLPALGYRTDVESIAQDWSGQMASAQQLSHNDGYFTNSTRSALNARALGENVGFSGSMRAVEQAFMNSPHHRENILDDRYTDIGIGVVLDSNGYYWVTQDFMQAADAPAAAPPATDPPADPAPAADAPPDTSSETPAPAPAAGVSAAAPAPEAAPEPAATTPATGESLPPLNPAVALGRHDDARSSTLVVTLGAGLAGLDALALMVARRHRGRAAIARA